MNRRGFFSTLAGAPLMISATAAPPDVRSLGGRWDYVPYPYPIPSDCEAALCRGRYAGEVTAKWMVVDRSTAICRAMCDECCAAFRRDPVPLLSSRDVLPLRSPREETAVLRAVYHSGVVCECGRVMVNLEHPMGGQYWGNATRCVCLNADCPRVGIEFKLPSVALERG